MMSTVGGSRERECVELIHASDSLSTVPAGSTNAFLPSKMSRQPIRVAKPPQPQPQPRQRSVQSSLVGNSYNDIVRLSEQQRKLIDSNRREIEEREARGVRVDIVDNAAARLAALRTQVVREEREMARLTAMQREAREVCAERMAAERQLFGLQSSFSSQEQQLRNAVSKVDSLKAQLDLLYRRRLSAMNAALAQQRKITLSQNQSLQSDDVSRSASSTDSSCSGSSSRPRASVEPFQISRPSVVPNRAEKRQIPLNSLPPPPPPPPPQLPRCSVLPSTDLNERVVFRAPLQQQVKRERERRDETPSPPKDPYPSPQNLLERPTALISDGKQKQQPDGVAQIPRRSANMRLLWDDAKVLNDEAPPADLMNETAKSPREEEAKVARADQISIRADTLRAAKRRSWAQQETSLDETEYIRKILCEEQKKGRTHIILDPHIENILSHLPHSEKTSAAASSDAELAGPIEAAGSETPASTSSVSEDATDESPAKLFPETLSKGSPKDEESDSGSSDRRLSLESEMEDTAINATPQTIDPETLKLIKPPPETGILRAVGVKKARRNIVFDPLALLLDAALEGEMDLVQSSASKMSDVSASNDEGITALHNAICAGHYDIVRFLVDSGADVNAQDSDGWTPLHCAASCNNLPMVKLLVENGGCIFAQTLSDLETPVEKCEEEEDGFDGCQLYLHSAHSAAGVVNQQKMYAAYEYKAERDDELSFPAGASLKVLERDGEERSWWLCEYVPHGGGSKETGLAPRNYLSLYPSLAARPADFVHFDLPVESPNSSAETNNNNADKESDALDDVIITDDQQPPVTAS